MIDNTAIKVESLSKLYRLYEKPLDRLKESLHPLGRKFHKDFHALQDVSFEVKKGEVVGVIGKNGSGKSTLLKILTGVLTKTCGSVVVNGRISALLELGAGFNPELTGLENVYFSGTVMGYDRRKMDSRLEQILSFAEIGDYINQPVKAYSSGMFLRLAFAVAIHVDPDILIIDEALAVGDELFQAKCIRRLLDLRLQGATVLLVSHSSGTVRQICDQVLLLDQGRKVDFGDPKEVLERYNDILYGAGRDSKTESNRFESRPSENFTGSGKARISDFGAIGQTSHSLCFEVGEEIEIFSDVVFNDGFKNIITGFMIYLPNGASCYHTNLYARCQKTLEVKKGSLLRTKFRFPLNLVPGTYLVAFDIQDLSSGAPEQIDIVWDALRIDILSRQILEDGGVAALNAHIDYEVLEC